MIDQAQIPEESQDEVLRRAEDAAGNILAAPDALVRLERLADRLVPSDVWSVGGAEGRDLPSRKGCHSLNESGFVVSMGSA
jgi:hypothetical protein